MKPRLNLHTVLQDEINVIGNAKSIFNYEYGELIDQHTTIRFNRAQIINEKSQGKRWDFLASSEVNTFLMYNNTQPPFHSLIFTPTKFKHKTKYEKINFDTELYTLPDRIYKDLTLQIQSVPSTGLLILSYLDGIKGIKVNIFGFDWKQTPTFYETREKGNHNFEREKEIVLDLVKSNNWKIY